MRESHLVNIFVDGAVMKTSVDPVNKTIGEEDEGKHGGHDHPPT